MYCGVFILDLAVEEEGRGLAESDAIFEIFNIWGMLGWCGLITLHDVKLDFTGHSNMEMVEVLTWRLDWLSTIIPTLHLFKANE